MNDNRNLILAIAITMLLLFGFDFYMSSQMEPLPVDEQTAELGSNPAPTGQTAPIADSSSAPSVTAAPGIETGLISPSSIGQVVDRDTALAQSQRIAIQSPRVTGSIRLNGGRIDDLTLLDYRKTLDDTSPNIILLSPQGTEKAYFADFGWLSTTMDKALLPRDNTPWTADGKTLTPETPVKLTWDNGNGLTFTRTYALDENYMVTVTQAVENSSTQTQAIWPYGVVNRTGTPKVSGFFILHEGLIGVFDEGLKEVDYDEDELREDKVLEYNSQGGWIGITDKYWLTALIPDQSARVKSQFRYTKSGGKDRYLVNNEITDAGPLAPGAKIEVTSRLFAGAKVSSMIDEYEEQYGIRQFDRAIDWGWFYWLTRPIFWVLHYFNGLIGNFGVAILLLTVLIKIAFFSLANKSYVAMGAMRKLQPKITAMRETHKDDPIKQREEMMKLYKEEKVNPVSGCLPILIQIPVFFALYKVLFVSIEMRHAPFFGWIQDLSAPDPLLVTTLFGLIPWDPPSFLAIGIWPLIMGITMWGQQKLNPAPPDPVQAKIFMFLPVIFTFMLASFPVGLVIYWTWNNLLTISQQWVIMKRHGAFD